MIRNREARRWLWACSAWGTVSAINELATRAMATEGRRSLTPLGLNANEGFTEISCHLPPEKYLSLAI